MASVTTRLLFTLSAIIGIGALSFTARRLCAAHELQPKLARGLSLKGVFVGSGSDGVGTEFIAKRIFSLSASKNNCKVLYIGTATYDLPQYFERQTNQFKILGCDVSALNVASCSLSYDAIVSAVNSANIIVVGGGNTLYAVDRWNHLRISELLNEAAGRGTVISGGSAGAICWFQSGHSDSGDPATFHNAMTENKEPEQIDESASSSDIKKDWSYIRVNGINMLPGMLCPHYDTTQSNGILRASDFDEMVRRHPTERGIGIDHWAALVLPGDGTYDIIAIPDKLGSHKVHPDGTVEFAPSEGVPGVWVVESDSAGQIKRTAVIKKSGFLTDLLREATGPIIEDLRCEDIRNQNPQPKDNTLTVEHTI